MDYEKEIKKLEAQIEELRAERELMPVWEPGIDEAYHVPNGHVISQYYWCHDEMDKYYLEMGNLFKTKQEAENRTRALKLIETIRRERYEAQGHWWPREHEARFSICGQQFGNGIDVDYSSWLLSESVFGLWQDSGVLIDVIEKYEFELEWYFTEYLPSIN